MVLRKITTDNSVRYIPKKEQTKEIKQNPTKNKKQCEQIQPLNKKISKNNKKLKDFTASGFALLK